MWIRRTGVEMETALGEGELATRLADVLDRVRGGERFAIVRDGSRVALLSPPEPATEPSPGITGRELVAKLGDLRMPGDGFADDIEAGRAVLLPRG